MSNNTAFPPVEYRRLGKSGLHVSVPILGAMSFGSDQWSPWVLNEHKALPLLKAAWDRGINTVDTANGYSNGGSERIIGKFIKKYNISREKIIILTKCYIHVDNTDISAHSYLNYAGFQQKRDSVNQGGLSRTAIFNQVEMSLERLQTSYIDVLQIHRFDDETPIEETMKALHDVVQSGKVRYIGACSMYVWQFAEMNHVAEKNGWTKFVSMQNEYSLLYREEEREMIPYCHANGIGLIPFRSLSTGLLARPLDSPETKRSVSSFGATGVRNGKGTPGAPADAFETIVNRVEEVAKKKGWSMAQVSLAWMMDTVSSPIVGCSSIARLEDSIISGESLTSEEKRFLEEPYVPREINLKTRRS